jgi:hypothetical protein
MRTSCPITLFLLFSFTLCLAETTRSNLVCREDIPDANRAELAFKLRKITGLVDLSFDSNGALRLGNRVEARGSSRARALLTKAVAGPNAIIVEDASRRSDVVFARVISARWKREADQDAPVFVVLVDFADFDCLIGDEPALKAFDVGWALLHELDHVIEESEDSVSKNGVGECEDHINQMRRECNLPLRADYFHTLFPVANEFTTKIVRLSFVQQTEGSRKQKRYWVAWDASVVGGLVDRRVAALSSR